MLIPEDWRRIGGIHLEEDGTLGAVFLALDMSADIVHCYDAALFRTEVPAVIADGLAARGRWIPLAWAKGQEAFSTDLLERGLNVLPEPSGDTEGVAEVISREIWQRMRGSRFRVEKHVGEWLDEARKFYRDDNAVPRTGFPLMSATRHAVAQLRYARPQKWPGAKRANHPNIRII